MPPRRTLAPDPPAEPDPSVRACCWLPVSASRHRPPLPRPKRPRPRAPRPQRHVQRRRPRGARKPTYSAAASSARKARLERARAAARVREQTRLRASQALQVAMTPRFKTDASGELVPDIRAAAAIIFNPETGKVLWEENAQDKRSIASITKVMTAVVFLEDNPDLSREVTVERSDVYAASTTYLQGQRSHHARQPAAPHAHRLGQRRRPRAGAHLARRHGRVRRADERKGARARAREHVLRRPVRPQPRQRVVGLRPVPADLRSPRPTSGSRRSCGPPSIRWRPAAAPFSIHSTNRLVRAATSK